MFEFINDFIDLIGLMLVRHYLSEET